MTTLRALTIVWLLAATAAASAQTASYANRDEAVHAAASSNADTRAEALAWIAGLRGQKVRNVEPTRFLLQARLN